MSSRGRLGVAKRPPSSGAMSWWVPPCCTHATLTSVIASPSLGVILSAAMNPSKLRTGSAKQSLRNPIPARLLRHFVPRNDGHFGLLDRLVLSLSKGSGRTETHVVGFNALRLPCHRWNCMVVALCCFNLWFEGLFLFLCAFL